MSKRDRKRNKTNNCFVLLRLFTKEQRVGKNAYTDANREDWAYRTGGECKIESGMTQSQAIAVAQTKQRMTELNETWTWIQ